MYLKFKMVKESLGYIFVYREYNIGTQKITVYKHYYLPNGEEGAELICEKEEKFAHSRRSFEKACSRIIREDLKK